MQEPSFEQYLDRHTDPEETVFRFIAMITVTGDIVGSNPVSCADAAEDEVKRAIDFEYLESLGLEVEVTTHADEAGGYDC